MRHLDGIYTQRFNRYRWSSHWGYLNQKQCPDWLNTESVMSRFGGVRGYREFMQREIEKEVVDFYKGPYQKPILGDKGFIERVKQKLGDKARVEEAKPESRRVFGLGIEEIVRATAREYKIAVEDLRRRGRGAASDAHSMAMYLCRVRVFGSVELPARVLSGLFRSVIYQIEKAGRPMISPPWGFRGFSFQSTMCVVAFKCLSTVVYPFH
jgi:hypothetical protein